jgi:hypothetical protein
MRESRTYGSVRGALSNERPYRDNGGSSSDSLAARRLGRLWRAQQRGLQQQSGDAA